MLKKCLKNAKTAAQRYDESASNDLARDLRFYYSKNKTQYAVDSIGDRPLKEAY